VIVLALALAQAPGAAGALEQLSPLTQAGVLVGLLAVFGVVIRMLFNQMIKSKDTEIAKAYERVAVAELLRDRYETKLDKQYEIMQTQVLAALKEASATTLRALEIIQRGNP
jgi:Na+-translocating ferredoxin:NAD+ oxidoreductase RnfG subunit